MKKFTKSVLITFSLAVFVMAVHLAELRSKKADSMTEAFTGLSRLPYNTAVISVSPSLY
jgi:hypothetical protein